LGVENGCLDLDGNSAPKKLKVSIYIIENRRYEIHLKTIRDLSNIKMNI
jgi:hypothetical protein